MSWFLIAILGHLSNGAAFLIDKILLASAFKRSATYAGLVGLLSLLVLAALPWVEKWPAGAVLILAALSGIIFIFALWTFFAALARAEASRVVPIIGSLIPVLTLAGTFLFLGEKLLTRQLAGLGLLVLATFLLSSAKGKGRAEKNYVWLSIASASLFASGSVTAKAVYDVAGFLPGFVTTRIAAGGGAIILLAFLDRHAGKEILSLFRPQGRERKGWAAAAMLLGQSLGAAGFVLVQYATAQGSAAIVNGLQAVQYAFLVLAGLILRNKMRRILGEDASRKALLVKTLALALTALGLILVL